MLADELRLDQDDREYCSLNNSISNKIWKELNWLKNQSVHTAAFYDSLGWYINASHLCSFRDQNFGQFVSPRIVLPDFWFYHSNFAHFFL